MQQGAKIRFIQYKSFIYLMRLCRFLWNSDEKNPWNNFYRGKKKMFWRTCFSHSWAWNPEILCSVLFFPNTVRSSWFLPRSDKEEGWVSLKQILTVSCQEVDWQSKNRVQATDEKCCLAGLLSLERVQIPQKGTDFQILEEPMTAFILLQN